MAPLSACDSAVSPCLCGCLVFLHRHFPPWSLPSCALGSSPCNQQQILPWVCSPILMLSFPAAVLSRGLVCLSGICVAVSMIVLLHQFISPSILPHIHSPSSMSASLLLPCKQVPSFHGSILSSGKKDIGHEMGERQGGRTLFKAVLDVCFLGFTINRSAECRWDISSE